MKQSKLFKSLLMLAALLLFGIKANAQEPYAVLSEDNTVLTFYYDNNKVDRNGLSVGPFISAEDQSWYNQHSTITSVVFDISFADCTSLTSTAFWFAGCTALTDITGIENLKTDNVTSMYRMFLDCSGLTSINVSGFKTGKVTNMNAMFANCSSLSNLDISNFETDSVTGMASMFYGCSSLTSLDISNFNTGKVTSMYTMFYNCSSLSNLDVSNFKTDSVTNMENMFSGCSSLTIIDVSNFKTNNVTNMAGMFYNCSNLESLDVSNFVTDKVETMEIMFAKCSKLTNLDVSGFNTENVTTMKAMFEWCNKLTSIDVTGFNTENVTDMSYMFWDCYALKSLDLSSFKTSNVTTMTWMFTNCNLTNLDVTNFDTGNVIDMDYMFAGCDILTSLDVSNFNTNKVTTMIGMFSGCYSLTSLVLSSFKTDNVTNMRYMFSDCRNLTSLDLSSFKTDNVTDMYGMFYECINLTTIYVSELWSTESVTSGDSMFFFCMRLQGGQGTYCQGYWPEYTDYTYARIDGGSLAPGYFTNIADLMAKWEPYAVLSDDRSVLTFYFDDKKVERGGMSVGPFVGYGDFNDSIPLWSDNSYIKTAEFDKSFAKCTSISSTAFWFYRCYGLASITGLDNLNTDNVTDMFGMFRDCYSLTILDLSTFNTHNVTDMRLMFDGCRYLTTIYVGDGWSTENVTWDYYMFYDCYNLVGEQGTTYDSRYTDHTYARVDGGPSAPGYFTYKDDITTGMNRITPDTQSGRSASVYSPSGQRLIAPHKGINIINGRKVVVK